MPVVEALDALQVRQWVLAREDTRQTVGDPSRYCAYGLIEIVDEAVLDDLKRALDSAAAEAAKATIQLTLPISRDWRPIHQRLMAAKVPLSGIGTGDPGEQPPDPNFKYEYFMLGDQHVRVTLQLNLTESERDTVKRILKTFERDDWWLSLMSRTQ
jgi:hypothetical protein